MKREKKMTHKIFPSEPSFRPTHLHILPPSIIPTNKSHTNQAIKNTWINYYLYKINTILLFSFDAFYLMFSFFLKYSFFFCWPLPNKTCWFQWFNIKKIMFFTRRILVHASWSMLLAIAVCKKLTYSYKKTFPQISMLRKFDSSQIENSIWQKCFGRKLWVKIKRYDFISLENNKKIVFDPRYN